MESRYPWLWDADLDNEGFDALLQGREARDGRDERWAILRLIEYAPWREIKRLLPRDLFLKRWPELSPRVRSEDRRKGMDFFHQWLREHPPAHG